MNYVKSIKTITGVVVGNLILGFVVAGFILPHGLVMGGATGLGISISQLLQIDLSLVVFIINGILFVLGAAVLGKKFALTTVISTVVYPVFLSLFRSAKWLQNLTDNVLLSTIYAGLLLGLGIGIIIRMGSSSGGTDIMALILEKKLQVPVAVGLYILDFIILSSQTPFSTSEQILYGILALLLTTIVLNRVALFGKAQIKLMVISDQYEQIREVLLKDADVGVTLLQIETGYGRQPQKGVMCVISNRRLYAVKEIIQRIDREAFTTITQINEVRGRGFTLERR